MIVRSVPAKRFWPSRTHDRAFFDTIVFSPIVSSGRSCHTIGDVRDTIMSLCSARSCSLIALAMDSAQVAAIAAAAAQGAISTIMASVMITSSGLLDRRLTTEGSAGLMHST